MYKSVSLILCALCMLTAASYNSNKIRCSEQLNEMMSLVCDGRGFNKITSYKRSSLHDDPLDPIAFVAETEGKTDSADQDAEFLNYPLTNDGLSNSYGERLSSLTTTRRRQRQQRIVDECCRKSCRVSELISYCLA